MNRIWNQQGIDLRFSTCVNLIGLEKNGLEHLRKQHEVFPFYF